MPESRSPVSLVTTATAFRFSSFSAWIPSESTAPSTATPASSAPAFSAAVATEEVYSEPMIISPAAAPGPSAIGIASGTTEIEPSEFSAAGLFRADPQTSVIEQTMRITPPPTLNGASPTPSSASSAFPLNRTTRPATVTAAQVRTTIAVRSRAVFLPVNAIKVESTANGLSKMAIFRNAAGKISIYEPSMV